MGGQTITILRFVILVTAREEPGWGKLKKWSGQAIQYENMHSKANWRFQKSVQKTYRLKLYRLQLERWRVPLLQPSCPELSLSRTHPRIFFKWTCRKLQFRPRELLLRWALFRIASLCLRWKIFARSFWMENWPNNRHEGAIFTKLLYIFVLYVVGQFKT